MNQSDKRLQIKNTLTNATSIIELAKKEGMNDIQLLNAIDLIKQLHLKESFEAMTVTKLEVDGKEVAKKHIRYLVRYRTLFKEVSNVNQKQKVAVVQKIIQTLADHSVSYADVPQIICEVESELKELRNQQVIKLP